MTPASVAAHGEEIREGRIGPNAVTRLEEAIRAVEGQRLLERIFGAAGLQGYLAQPPSSMVDEREVSSLHRALHAALGDPRARTVAWIAGQRTADYLLARRIPKPAQAIMRWAPPSLASRILLAAISANAWTFTGTGDLEIRHGRPTQFIIRNCPVCREARSAEPWGDFYAGALERLFAKLVHAGARVRETTCQAMGDARCAFTITW